MATAPSVRRRHALGLPAGSVRSLHVLLVVGLFCAVILIPTKSVAAIPPYLIYLMFIILGHFFAAHGVSIGTSESQGSPLHLPRGLVRFLIIAALAGSIGWMLYNDPAHLEAQYDASLLELKQQPLVPVFILGGFLLGVILRGLVGRNHDADWFQDFEAWTSLVALLGLGVAVIIHSVINPSMETPISLPGWEAGLGAVIAFYFGERS